MVRFRPVTLQDVPALYGFRTDEEVLYWGAGGYGDALPTMSEFEEQVRSQRATDGRRLFAIEAEAEGGHTLIGSITFRGLDRISRRATIGMMIGDKRYWGRGYGTAVVRQFVRFLFTSYNLHRIDIDTFSDNERAIRCYKKCGFVEEGRLRKAMWTTKGYRDQVMMGLLREDWEAAQVD
ncbi:MAG TPA: GNAT family protein [Symbiobacteriaceae bacterium]|nr:GNAT family protein [Symbiobacteriaceae bacterium]